MGVDLGTNPLGRVLESLGLIDHLSVLTARLHALLEALVSFPPTEGEREPGLKRLNGIELDHSPVGGKEVNQRVRKTDLEVNLGV